MIFFGDTIKHILSILILLSLLEWAIIMKNLALLVELIGGSSRIDKCLVVWLRVRH